jgi:hypothetical protein
MGVKISVGKRIQGNEGVITRKKVDDGKTIKGSVEEMNMKIQEDDNDVDIEFLTLYLANKQERIQSNEPSLLFLLVEKKR